MSTLSHIILRLKYSLSKEGTWLHLAPQDSHWAEHWKTTTPVMLNANGDAVIVSWSHEKQSLEAEKHPAALATQLRVLLLTA